MAKSKRAKRVLTHVLGGSATPVLPITDVIGATPRERLAWLLEFAYLDLQSIDRAAHSALWGLLAGLVKDATRGQWRVPDSERPEREAFRLLKSGRPFESDKDPWYPGRLDLVQAWV